jgi:hypothetical protein
LEHRSGAVVASRRLFALFAPLWVAKRRLARSVENVTGTVAEVREDATRVVAQLAD